MASDTVDWDAEGLLDGLDEDARRSRKRLLDGLWADGVTLEELRSAAEDGRLVALPALQLLGGPPRASARDAAQASGLDLDLVLATRRANGIPVLDPDAPLLSDSDLAMADVAAAAMASGVTPEQVVATARVLGHATRQIADQMGTVLFELAYKPGLAEHEVAERLAARLGELQPLIEQVASESLRIQFRETVQDAASAAADQLGTEGLHGSRPMAVAFADLVGFTKLGEQVAVEELEGVARRLAVLAGDVVNPPVRFVKTIGDAAMLVSPDAGALTEAALGLVEAADEAGEDFPRLRVGVSYGPVLSRGGDWFGSPVNLASRVTSLARTGTVLATGDVREHSGNGAISWSEVGRRRLRGVPHPVALYRARRT
jgi:adenylate cyclase